MSGEKEPYRGLLTFFDETGKVSLFTARFFREAFRPPFEFRELLRQSYIIGYQSLFLVATTGFIMGLVFDLQTRPTMIEFGAESYMPSMIGISFVREIGPVVTALICAGKIGSSIGAELGSMRVTEQIDAMEVSGTNPFKFLVVTRVLAAMLMVPVLVLIADAIGLFAAFLVENLKGDVTFRLFFNQVFNNLEFGDLIPSTVKSFFFGLAIGLIGCYKGYYAARGTAGVGSAANQAVVVASLLLFVIDLIAVLIADIFYEL
ncbi:MAG: ABC transporter permease [Saprospiraceae bacterium]|nr:ABC transporter permease [Saprospiraceae bacterium]MCB0626770.1 ABC transporter permease [Saprospiraceae bacterium]MCB0675936.1 ABC transporter permease [Saprospiraceae bacterium]MCB0683870.1 ABC transporter permease [Saprospiraceae bacterium]